MASSIRHFGIVVRDLEKSLTFYRDLLGLKVESSVEEKGDYLDNLLALKNVRAKVVKMFVENGTAKIELLQFVSPLSPVSGRRSPIQIGPTHVAFSVHNLDLLYERLINAGVRFTCKPQLGPDGKAKASYCYDPDGTLVELVEDLSGKLL